MPKKFANVEERRVYWRDWYQRNKHREDYKAYDRATKKRIRKERKAWYLELKKELRCENFERCGVDDFRCLDFHHKDPSGKIMEVSIMALRAASKEKILEEIAKCRVLCSNCHRIEHWEERNKI